MRNIQFRIDLASEIYSNKACMQYDDLKLEIEIYSGGVKYNLPDTKVTLNWLKPDNAPLSVEMNIKDNIANVELDRDFTDVPGMVKMELEIEKEGQATSFELELYVNRKLFNSEKVNTTILKLIETIKIDEAINAFLDGIKEKVNEISNSLLSKVDLAQVITYPLLDEEKQAIKNIGISENEINIKFPYCHVNRYGADDTGELCSANAIQCAVDCAELIAKNNKVIYPIKFTGGTYLVTKTITCKAKDFCLTFRPLTFLGEERKQISNSIGNGTVIVPKIENYSNKEYANLFTVNMAIENDKTTESEKTYFGSGINAKICDNITFKNLAFVLPDTEAQKYNINVIKAYRARFTLDNIFCCNMRQLMCQPERDIDGGSSYCDFSSYTNINFVKMKYRGLELYNSDCSKIEDITNHLPGKDFDSLILVRGGGAYTIKRIHFAYNFEEGTLTPRNLGRGPMGTKAFIKIAHCKGGVSIEGIYCERQLLDYMFYIYNSNNVKIKSTYEAFFGNGYAYVAGASKNISIENVTRSCNLVKEYYDIYFNPITALNSISIKNFKCSNWYNEEFSLDTEDYSNLTKDDNNTPRLVKSNGLKNLYNYNFNLETVSFCIKYVNSTWSMYDFSGKTIGEYVTFEWVTNPLGRLIINPVSNSLPFAVKEVLPLYTQKTSGIVPIVRYDQETYSVCFWDLTENKYVETQNENLAFILNVETLKM